MQPVVGRPSAVRVIDTVQPPQPYLLEVHGERESFRLNSTGQGFPSSLTETCPLTRGVLHLFPGSVDQHSIQTRIYGITVVGGSKAITALLLPKVSGSSRRVS
eukprot:scaffold350_cov333-Pavlova_lutheri.AAC.20